MFDRFTRKSRTGRGKIPREMREKVFARDEFVCQFCMERLSPAQCTIDHLAPVALDGIDEMTNYVTACQRCNSKKGHLPLAVFAAAVNVKIETLPVHGDPVIDNEDLPLQFRLIRKRIFDRMRMSGAGVKGRQVQKKIEKRYRRKLWESEIGKKLAMELPSLPGQVRAVVPEIRAIATSEYENLLLLELAKSATTRNLINASLSKDADVIARVKELRVKSKDPGLVRRLDQAILRFKREIRRRGLKDPLEDFD